jgi:hypothetical protein
MGFNPAALYVVADRLHQAEDDWRPFHAPVWLRSFFPRAESWQHLHSDDRRPGRSGPRVHAVAHRRAFRSRDFESAPLVNEATTDRNV